MKKITVRQLRKLGACHEEIFNFRKIFGRSVKVTRQLAMVHALDFGWNQASAWLLHHDSYISFSEEYARIYREYYAARAKISLLYVDRLWAHAADEGLRREYLRQLADLFAKLYLEQ